MILSNLPEADRREAVSKEIFSTDEKVLKKHPPEPDNPVHDVPDRQEASPTGITLLQQQVGNRAVQRLLAQRSGQPAEVEDETAQQIEQERGRGQEIDQAVQEKLGAKMGPMGTSGPMSTSDFDFSQVKVHTSPKADALNRELGAEAFTTGKDIFFREGAYDPHSSSGQELLAHEMTHVVQQSSGLTGGEAKMTVNAPNDAFEQQADAVAREAIHSPGTNQGQGVQRQEEPEEEEVQMQELEDEEEQIQMRQEEEDELENRPSASSQETAQAGAGAGQEGEMPSAGTAQAAAPSIPVAGGEQEQAPRTPSEQSARSKLEEEETLQMKKRK
jgi:hypothetical protein